MESAYQVILKCWICLNFFTVGVIQLSFCYASECIFLPLDFVSSFISYYFGLFLYGAVLGNECVLSVSQQGHKSTSFLAHVLIFYLLTLHLNYIL